MMKPRIKIILADDHLIVRDGIKALLKSEPELEIIGETDNGEELIQMVEKTKPDIVLMDISMTGMSGIEATKILKTEKKTQTKVLILSMFVNEEFVINAVKAGADGYLPKNTNKDELITAVYTICEGRNFYGELVSKILVQSLLKKVKEEEEDSAQQETLTKRELEILKFVAEGMTNQEIADSLFISIRTVESHKNHIMQKMGFNSMVDLVKYALKNKIISL